MRPQNLTARDRLTAELRRNALISAIHLADRLRISVPTVLRILKERTEDVIRIGTTKNARYVLRRPLRGNIKTIPIYCIDQQGKGHDCTTLELVQPNGSIMDLLTIGWPIDPESKNHYWGGLPYPLYNMQPQGFLGRHFARQMAIDLEIPRNINDWTDDHVVTTLTQRGADTSGNLIVGDVSYEQWLKNLAKPCAPLSNTRLANSYADLADNAMNMGIPASSAAGEFPKFTASRALSDAVTPHVIVKFSGADKSSAVVRWSDLLICENLALSTISETTSLLAAKSRILQAQNRTFFEVERFDRHGLFGRSEVVTLSSIQGALLSSTATEWPELIHQFTKIKLTSKTVEEQVRFLWWYGKLIANTDMHMGNLSFQFQPIAGFQPELRLTPTYDMLPMFYAPLAGGEVPIRVFEPNLPLPKDRDVWIPACTSALFFWQLASSDSRISEAFRKVCHENFQRLNELQQLV